MLNQVLLNFEVLGEHIIWAWIEVASLEEKNQKSRLVTLLCQFEQVSSFLLVFVSSSVKCSISQARLGYATVTNNHQNVVILYGSHSKTQAYGGHISVLSWLLQEKKNYFINCFFMEMIYVTSDWISLVKLSHVAISSFKEVGKCNPTICLKGEKLHYL